MSISSKFYARVFRAKVLFPKNVTREKLLKRVLYKKCACKMLMKLTPEFNVTHLDAISVGEAVFIETLKQ